MFPNYIRRIAAKPCILNVNRGKWLRSARKTNSGGNIINEGQGDDRAGEDDFARYGEAGPPPRQGRSRGGHGRVCMVEFREMAKEQAEAARAGTKRPSRSASTTRAPWRPIRRTIGPQPSPRARGDHLDRCARSTFSISLSRTHVFVRATRSIVACPWTFSRSSRSSSDV